MKTWLKCATLLLLLIFGSNAQSQTLIDVEGDVVIPADKNFKFKTPKTKYLGISSWAFNPDESSAYDFETPASNVTYRIFQNGSFFFGYAIAPLNLPDGATLKELKAWVYDDNADEFIRVRLYRSPYGNTGGPVQVGEVETAQAFNSATVEEITTSTFTPGMNVIDNSTFTYFVEFSASRSDSDVLRLYDVRIEYEVENLE